MPFLSTLSVEHWLVVLSTLISISGAYIYVRDTIRGTTKPNRVTWFMWALGPLIGTAAAYSSGADLWATFRVFLAGFIPLVVFIASFCNPKSYWQLTAFDCACGIFSGLALLIWILIDSPTLAILFAALGDAVASIPTIKKAWIYPKTESGLAYIASVLSVLLVLPSIPSWTVENCAFQIYLLIANAVILFSIYRNKFIPAFQIG